MSQSARVSSSPSRGRVTLRWSAMVAQEAAGADIDLGGQRRRDLGEGVKQRDTGERTPPSPLQGAPRLA